MISVRKFFHKHVSFHVLSGWDWYHFLNNDPMALRGLFEQGLSFLYKNETGHYFSWQLRVEKTNINTAEGSSVLSFKTRFPIMHPNLVTFWTSKEDVKIINTDCMCDVEVDGTCSCCHSCLEGKRLFADYVMPGSPLGSGEYTVNGGGFGGGYWGNLITYKYCKCGEDQCGCSRDDDDIYVAYIAGYPEIECRDQIIPIPYALYDSLAFYMAGLVAINSQGFRPSEENTFFQLAQSRRKENTHYDNKMPTSYVTEGFDNYDACCPADIYMEH